MRVLSAITALLCAQTRPAVVSAGDVKTLLYVGNSFFYFKDSLVTPRGSR